MIKFKYRYCKVHMAQYLSGELPDTTRRRVARYIDDCDACYNEYIQQRNLANKLERDLPTLGRPTKQSVDHMWATIQTELTQPTIQSNILNKPRHTTRLSYSLIMLMMAFMLMIPFAVGYHTSMTSVDLPPHPKTINLIKTPTTVAQHTELATVTQSTVPIRMPLLHNTPAPIFRQ